ncbi:hypothetical protein [Arthrobacter cryoconiti]|uniref:DNA-binding protein n=1 Tax=Arthrobacter cryoconiti TaxID=748907 RepID=A0ABV8R565_9MICC|nr:hypothetical protein [Arthrobacter cryoconiti]MCC9069447.1 hypothetical protein [Arthrobacter cryoconiti]
MVKELGRDWLTTDEVAALMGIKPASVSQQASNARKLKEKWDPDFPQPVAQKITIYSREEVMKYLDLRAQRNPNRKGRPPAVSNRTEAEKAEEMKKESGEE